MGAYSSIGDLTVARGLQDLELADYATIGRLNWITAYPKNKHQFFASSVHRNPSLLLGAHAAITHRHIIDCTDQIAIGPFTTIAGYRSQVITHSIEPSTGSQQAKPIRIGEYCFVGTSCVILGGASLPGYSILSAMSLLNHQFVDTYALYAGAQPKRSNLYRLNCPISTDQRASSTDVLVHSGYGQENSGWPASKTWRFSPSSQISQHQGRHKSDRGVRRRILRSLQKCGLKAEIAAS
jgi:acetyltransferase-like isoleucine patch superfamily enzyme